MAFPHAIPYDGYPGPGVSAIRYEWRGDYVAPSNYQAGGYNLNAAELGMSRLENVSFGARTQSGNYYALSTPPALSGNNETRAIPPSYVNVKWYAANGTEVANNTNLSAEITYLGAIGI